MKKLDLTYANRGLDPRVIAVHDGRFHVDDVFAAMLMRSIYPGVKIIRTRDEVELNKADIVIDVGSVYDTKSLRFDHHQEGKAGARENGVEFSGFGLVWKEWGLLICKGDTELFNEIDISLVQPIDAHDNGQAITVNSEENFEGISDITINKLIGIINPPSPKSIKDYDENFEDAMYFAEFIFSRYLEAKKSSLEERADIVSSYNSQEDRRFMIDENYRPVLRQADLLPELLYYVFPREVGGSWLIKCAGEKTIDDPKNRKPFPKEWAGKSGKELEKASGIKDMEFCHNNLFICGAKNKEAILKALDAALEY
jgi:uncharacterized UPF0160 family protein